MKMLTSLIAFGCLFITEPFVVELRAAESNQINSFHYEPKDFSYLLGMKGLSNKLLQQHFELYRGYVKQTNIMLDLMQQTLDQTPFLPLVYSSLKKSFAFEYNGMKLHELFFENLSKQSIEINQSLLKEQIEKDFGSLDAFKHNLSQTALSRGIGWVLCYFDKSSQKLINAWIESHDKGSLVEGEIILVLDIWEHAYINDYGINRQNYMKAIMSAINWEVAEERLKKAF